MDEGLLMVLVIAFVMLSPIVVSFFILNLILRDRQMSLIGLIIGFIGTFIIGYIFQLFSYFDLIFGKNVLIFMIISSIILTVSIGLIVIKIFRR